jgi:hypothetical protein
VRREEVNQLPTFRKPLEGETLQGYALAVLGFVLETGVTASLPTKALELADHCYPLAVRSAEILPATVDKLSAARHLILQTLRWRREAEDSEAQLQACKLRQGHVGAAGQGAKLLPPGPGGLSGGALALGDKIDVPF